MTSLVCAEITDATMQTFFLTVVAVFLLTGGMCLAIVLGALFGRRRPRRCACGEAKRVAKILAERKRLARQTQNYSPATVDPNHLPIINTELAGIHGVK